jgi:hypothetical protein
LGKTTSEGSEAIPEDLQGASDDGSDDNVEGTPEADTATVSDCSPEAAAALFESAGPPLSDASNWVNPNDLTTGEPSTTQVVYGPGDPVAEFEVPKGHSVDYDPALDGDGRAESGETIPAGAMVFTLNCA